MSRRYLDLFSVSNYNNGMSKSFLFFRVGGGGLTGGLRGEGDMETYAHKRLQISLLVT